MNTKSQKARLATLEAALRDDTRIPNTTIFHYTSARYIEITSTDAAVHAAVIERATDHRARVYRTGDRLDVSFSTAKRRRDDVVEDRPGCGDDADVDPDDYLPVVEASPMSGTRASLIVLLPSLAGAEAAVVRATIKILDTRLIEYRKRQRR